MTEEELRRLADAMAGQAAATRELTEFTRFQSEAANAAAAETNRLAAAEKDAAAASARNKAKFDAVSGAAGAVADAFITYNKEVYKGASASQAAAASIDKMGEAAKYAGAFLAILVPGGPIVKAFVAGLGLLTGELMKAGKEVAIQTDQIYKAYQDMAKAGATGAGGMQDVFDGLQKVGLGTEKFGEYLKLVNENANELAMFGGTVRSGRKEFEKTMGSLTKGQREDLELMVGGREAQAEAGMTFIKQQRLMTMGTKAQMDMSSAAVMKYVKETDELTRITGANRAEQQKILEKAMSEEIFASFTDGLNAQGEAGQKRAKQEANNAIILEKLIGPEFARGIRDGAAGFVGATEASRKALMSSGGAAAEYAHEMEAAGGDAEKSRAALDRLIKGVSQNYKEIQQGLGQMGASESVFNKVSETRKAQLVEQLGVEGALLQAKKEQEDALKNDPTRKMAEAENKAREHQLFLQGELNKGMEAFITGLGKGQTANQEMIDYIMKDLMPAFKKLLEALEPLGTELGKLGKELVPAFNIALELLTGAIETAAKFIKGTSDVINAEGTDAKVQAAGKAGMTEIAAGVGGGVLGAKAGAAGGAAAGLGLGLLTGPAAPVVAPALAAILGLAGGAAGAYAGYQGGSYLGKKADEDSAEGGIGKDWDNFKSFIGMRADGGPVSAKTPYLVGEEGPELFVPSLAGDIVPTGQLQGTGGTALKQSQAIEDMVSQIVLNTTAIAKTADVDADRAKDHSKELKTQREKIDNAIKEIAVNSVTMDSVYKTDLKRAQDYSIFYKGFIETKTKFEKEQLDAINYQMTEGSSGGSSGSGSSGGGTGLKLPTMPGIASMGGGQGMQTTRQDDLKKLGLNIKEGDVQAEGAGISPKLIEMARQIQGGVPGFGYFSAFNDKFHQEKAPGSQHAKGLAVDFTVAQPPSVEDGKAITDWLKGLGASLAVDEYNNPSSKSTAGHFHAQIPGFEDGGTLGAGKVGIAGEGGAPELITGPANITPMNDLMRAFGDMTSLLQASVSRLDAIARHTAATQDTSNKMLSYAQN